MNISYLDIDPTAISNIVQFDWKVRAIAQGYKFGKKLSRKLGSGLEFSQYRPYSQGDDIRKLDWKMYARSDRYYIKESEIETQLEVTFVLDTSRSMSYQEGKHSKFQYAKLLTGIMAYLSLQEGDSVGLAAAGYQISGQDPGRWKRFVHELTGRQLTDRFVAPGIVNMHRKELFVVLTDHYDRENDIPEFVKNLKSNRNEIIILHLLGNKERTLEFETGDRFQDLETGQILTFDPSKKRHYTDQLTQWTNSLYQQYLSLGIDYLSVDFTQPFAEVMMRLQQHRKNLL
jgi:hypothetical protein